MKRLLNGKWEITNNPKSFLIIKNEILEELLINGNSLLDSKNSKVPLEKFNDSNVYLDIDNCIGIILLNQNKIEVKKYLELINESSAELIGIFYRKV